MKHWFKYNSELLNTPGSHSFTCIKCKLNFGASIRCIEGVEKRAIGNHKTIKGCRKMSDTYENYCHDYWHECKISDGEYKLNSLLK